jgi:hypothetical protein
VEVDVSYLHSIYFAAYMKTILAPPLRQDQIGLAPSRVQWSKDAGATSASLAIGAHDRGKRIICDEMYSKDTDLAWQVLEELGYSRDEIESLRQRSII